MSQTLLTAARLGVLSVSAIGLGFSALQSEVPPSETCLCIIATASCPRTPPLGGRGEIGRLECIDCQRFNTVCCDGHTADVSIDGALLDAFDCGTGCSYNENGVLTSDFQYCPF